MSLITDLARDSIKTIKDEGFASFADKATNFVGMLCGRQMKTPVNINRTEEIFKDVLFINGCGPSVPHPARYRVTHQREQLEACRVTTGEVFYGNLQIEQVRCYRVFIFFRCPYTDTIGRFIELAKKLNKHVLFDIDDLVIDTKYTDNIKCVSSMKKAERELYDDGVKRMGRTLRLCDAAITTTERLATELGKYVSEVFINRNTSSEAMIYYSNLALENKQVDNAYVKMGYFSGSFTHNDDFELVKPILLRLLKKYGNLQLHLVGELDLPEDLAEYNEKIVRHPFVDWKKLPELIASVDINIAPLEQGIFNEAKSENKWVEAALVKVPTVASNVGAFTRMIENGKTGFLCSNTEEWEKALSVLIEDKEERAKIAENAYVYCMENCTTIRNGYLLAQFIKKYMTTNIGFVVPPMTISGGILVALRHATMLMEAGYDVMMLEAGNRPWIEFEGHQIPVVNKELQYLWGRIDKAVATMWTTVGFLEHYPNIGERYYLIQGFEPDFYGHNNPERGNAYAMYHPRGDVKFITISKWCQGWLKNEMKHEAYYAPNGIDIKSFPAHRREFGEKIRILVEGNCRAALKNVDESFKIINKLDLEKFEIWYLSYNSKPKAFYHVDKAFSKVPYAEVSQIYSQCDILLKSSYSEGFSYPPLEMMATGGYSVVVPNGGNREYLVDGENCLFYPLGDIDKGVEAIYRICEDANLRERLYEGGIKTAENRDWKKCKRDILALYDVE